MMKQTKRWVVGHPYFSTSVIFLLILLFGWYFLYWNEENLAFLLLLYFIVTLGIRLDDISRKIGASAGHSSSNPGDKENIIGELKAIKSSVQSLNATLTKVLEKTEKEDL